MTDARTSPRRWPATVAPAATAVAACPAHAGGLFLYEFGTAEPGLAAAGYAARAQDASTAFTNPASMTRLDDTQVLAGGQLMWLDAQFSPGPQTSPGLGSDDVSPLFPVNAAWRLGAGAERRVRESFKWGFTGEVIYGGTIGVDKRSRVPPLLGGRGDLVGSYDSTLAVALTVYGNWTL